MFLDHMFEVWERGRIKLGGVKKMIFSVKIFLNLFEY